MRYAVARYQRDRRDMAYRIYVTDCLRMITQNTAHKEGDHYITAEYSELIDPNPKETRTGDEIAADVIKRAGIEVIW